VTYEWPVIQPQSAVQKNTSLWSSVWVSKVYLNEVAAPSMYPPVVWRMPFGLPVDPEV